MTTPGQLSPPTRLLLGPGPSDVHPRVLTALASPLVGHLDPYFLQIMNETQEMLRRLFQTRNPLTFAVSATGMAGMEACMVNLLEPGDRALICSKGVFGQRMADVASRTGASVSVLERPWGQVFDLDQIREALQRERPKVLGIVHAETSTGAWQPVEELGRMCREFDTLLVLDTVTSLGCIPVALDDWKVDAAFSCSQKGLSCPPGLAPVSFGERALDAVRARKSKVQSWYLDLTMIERYWGQDRFYHHTAPVSMVYALREALRVTMDEGLQARWDRHQRNHLALRAGLDALGMTYVAAEGHQLPQLNAVRIPAGVDDAAVRTRLLEEFSIEIGSGLGDLKGKIWRIGLMGYNSRPTVVQTFLGALEQCLIKEGARIAPGSSVAAANRAYLA